VECDFIKLTINWYKNVRTHMLCGNMCVHIKLFCLIIFEYNYLHYFIPINET